MKKIFVLLGLVSAFVLTACGAEPEPVDPPEIEVSEESNDEFDINLENGLEELDAVE